MPLSWTMDKIGPMCRSAEDCGLVLAAIAGKDGNDPSSAGKSFYYFPKYHRDIKTIRVGYAPADFEQQAQEAARPAFRDALEVFRKLGVQLREVPQLPDLPYGPLTTTIIGAEGSSVFEELIESGQVNALADRKQIAGLKAGLEIGARDYLKAMRARRLVQMELRALLTDLDVLLAPARYNIASKLDEPLDRSTPPVAGAAQVPSGMRALIPAANLAGLPGLSLPCGFAEGMPVALQLVSRPFTENLLLSAGIQFQNVTDWHRRRPKVWPIRTGRSAVRRFHSPCTAWKPRYTNVPPPSASSNPIQAEPSEGNAYIAMNPPAAVIACTARAQAIAR
jgi:aspartyl-tRNA(Asn)/glutamyl-tRNA(Gln) amidotransferase subunit A